MKQSLIWKSLAVVCVSVGFALATSAAAQSKRADNHRSEATVFVERGQPKLIRPVGVFLYFGSKYIELNHGPRQAIYAGREVGGGDFHLKAQLSVNRPEDLASFAVDLVKGQLEGFVKKTWGYMTDVETNRIRHLLVPPTLVKAGEPFLFEAIRRAGRVEFRVDGKVFHDVMYQGRFGAVGFTVFSGRMRIYDFSVIGKTEPLRWKRTQLYTFSIPQIDISREEHRQVIVEKNPEEDLAHPNTVLLADNQTLLAVYARAFKGGSPIVLNKSIDGGKSWLGRQPVHSDWDKRRHSPMIHRLTDLEGVERLFVFSDHGSTLKQSISLDNGLTWGPFKVTGLRSIGPPMTVVPISGGRVLVSAFHIDNLLFQSFSRDGGLNWEPQTPIAGHDGYLAEPCIIPSPGGRQLVVLARENTRAYNSVMIVSNDAGQSWSEPVEVPGSLSGDRHNYHYAQDGRLVITLRDSNLGSRQKGSLVAWVGTYGDLIRGDEGQYRVVLLRGFLPYFGGSVSWAGLDLLPDGTFVATASALHKPGEEYHCIISVRFTLEELDQKYDATMNDWGPYQQELRSDRD